jgi:hypothetical protein
MTELKTPKPVAIKAKKAPKSIARRVFQFLTQRFTAHSEN